MNDRVIIEDTTFDDNGKWVKDSYYKIYNPILIKLVILLSYIDKIINKRKHGVKYSNTTRYKH